MRHLSLHTQTRRILKLNLKSSISHLTKQDDGLRLYKNVKKSSFFKLAKTMNPDSRIMHDYAFIYVGQRSADEGFLHRGRFYAISEAAARAYKNEGEAYLNEMLSALLLTKGQLEIGQKRRIRL